MNAAAYRDALKTLGLTQHAAGRWLGVSPRTAQKFAADGPSPPAARAVAMLIGMTDAGRAAALSIPHPSAEGASR